MFWYFSIIVILFLIYFFNKIYKEGNENKRNIEIIISRYNENIDFLKNEPFNKYPITIYNKGNDTYFKPDNLKESINLDNVGVCVHSYLYFIIHNYENLPNITIFLPASCLDEHKKEKTLKTIEKVNETNNSVFYCNHYNNVREDLYDFVLEEYLGDNTENRELNNDSNIRLCDIRPFGKWYETVFPDININDVNYKGIFAVSKQHILNRSKESYKELLNYVNKNKNEECGHYFERSFIALFHPIPKECIF